MLKKEKRPLFHYIVAAFCAALVLIVVVQFMDSRTPLQRKHNVIMFDNPVDVREHVITFIEDGKDYKIENLLGEISVLAFWTPWCGYCAQEFPQIDRINDMLIQRGVRIIPIVRKKEPKEDVARFYQRLSLKTMPPYSSDDGVLYRKVGVRGFPTFIVVDEEGRAFTDIRPKWTEEDIFDMFKELKEWELE